MTVVLWWQHEVLMVWVCSRSSALLLSLKKSGEAPCCAAASCTAYRWRILLQQALHGGAKQLAHSMLSEKRQVGGPAYCAARPDRLGTKRFQCLVNMIIMSDTLVDIPRLNSEHVVLCSGWAQKHHMTAFKAGVRHPAVNLKHNNCFHTPTLASC
jgi:hypothetical protein